MRYFYTSWEKLFPNLELTDPLARACDDLHRRFSSGINTDNLCPFMATYWNKKIQHPEITFQQATYIIGNGLTLCKKKFRMSL